MLDKQALCEVGVPVHPKYVHWGWVQGKQCYMNFPLFTVALSCWNMFGLGLLFPVKSNREAKTYKDILDNCTFSNLWQQLGGTPYEF